MNQAMALQQRLAPKRLSNDQHAEVTAFAGASMTGMGRAPGGMGGLGGLESILGGGGSGGAGMAA